MDKWHVACRCGAAAGDTHSVDCTLWAGKVYPTFEKNRVYETMTRFSFGRERITVRVWRSVPDLMRGPDSEVVGVLMRLNSQVSEVTFPDIVAALETCISGLAAYEILDVHGQGCVVYPDWK